MKKHPGSAKTVWTVAAAAALVVFFILAAFLLSLRDNERDAIRLPDASAHETESQSTPEREKLLVTVDSANIQKLLATMDPPEAYHQVVELTSLWRDGSDQSRAELWKSDGLLRADVQRSARTLHLLTDGKTVYLWYDSEKTARRLEPDGAVKIGELIGMPVGETLLGLKPEQIQEAGFVSLEDQNKANCLYLSTVPDADGYADRYWINVDSHLLCKADTQLSGEQIYRISQISQETLTAGDTGLEQQFRLPDGTAPFATAG